MTVKLVDARTLSCPQPVMLTIKALNEADEVVTIVDNEAARENVSRLGKSKGCEVDIEQKADGIFITLRKTGTAELRKDAPTSSDAVLFIGTDVMGSGDDQLGVLLMQKFLHTLSGLASRPEAILLVNSGVKLAIKGSLTAEALSRLADQGVEIKACGTCLSYLQLSDKVGVGEVSDMYTIADTLIRAERVISL